MQNNLILQLPIIPVNQLFSTCETSQDLLDTLCLTQHYRANSDQMNIIPIPVKRDNSADQPRYEVLANHHIFFSLKKAQCPLARCLSLNRPEEQPEIWQAELQVEPAKLNVASSNQEELHEAFAYLTKREKGLAKLLSHGELIQALANHPSRPYWSSWDPIKALAKSHKVTITKKHTNCLDNHFCFVPQLLPRLCINTASAEEFSGHIKILLLGLDVRQKILRKLLSHRELILKLVNDSSRPYWSSWKPFEALAKTLIPLSKIEKRHTERLDEYFLLHPQISPGSQYLFPSCSSK